MLDQLEPAPAFVSNHLTDVLAWTEGFDRLARPLGILDGDQPNLLWFTFADERARTAYADWDHIADEQVADLHAEHYGDSEAQALADRLARTAGATFTDRWARVAVPRRPTGVRGLAHPEVGLLRLAFETLDLPADDRQRLVVYLAADAATSTGLDRLIGRNPGSLRSVRSR